MMETWKDIPGYDGKYRVSSRGRIIGLSKYSRNGAGSFLSQKPLAKGYPVCILIKNGKRKQTSFHQMVALAFLGEPKGLEVNHKNGIRTDNRVENLEYVTHGENGWHGFNVLGKKRNCKRGESHPHRKITYRIAEKIRAEYVPWKNSTYKLARKYKVCNTTVFAIIKNKTWLHV